MDLPKNLKIQGVLIQGGAFKVKLPNINKERFYFVLNQNPQDDTIIVLSTSTTAFDLHKSCRGGNDVHINISPEDYKPFPVHCLICCDRPVRYNKTELIEILQSEKFDLLPQLPSAILERIKNGIAKSPAVEPKIKQMILGPDNTDY